MKKATIILWLIGCVTINNTDYDNSLLFMNNDKGEIVLSTTNSAQQIKITKCLLKEDTLIVNYKRGALIRPKNILPLNDKIRYLKCANKIYVVNYTDSKYNLKEVGDEKENPPITMIPHANKDFSIQTQENIDENNSDFYWRLNVSYLLLPYTNILQTTDNSSGVGIYFDETFPMKRSGIQVMAGLGFSWYESESNHYDKIIMQSTMEYMHLSCHLNVGYNIIDRKHLIVTPYIGLIMKENLQFKEKLSCPSNSFDDVNISVYGDNILKDRLMLQYDIGLELGYRRVYVSMSYARDFSRMTDAIQYKILTDEERTFQFNPGIIRNWRLGLGINF